MNPVGKHFANRNARDKYLADYVTSTIRNSEEQTMPSRRQWQVNSELFAGRMDWGQDDEGAEWQSRLFLHEYAPMIREGTMAVCEMLQQFRDFITIEAYEGGDSELARILEKIIKYYMFNRDEMAFPTRFVEFVLSGCCFGMATFKNTVRQSPRWKPEVVMERIDREMRSRQKRSGAEGDEPPLMPNGLDEMERGIESALLSLLGGEEGGLYRRDVKSKKTNELSLKLRTLNPHNFFWHPDSEDINESPWMADISYPKFFELIPYFESGVLDKRKAKRVLNSSGRVYAGSRVGMYGSREYQKFRQMEQYAVANGAMPECELIDYWGPIPSPDGGELIEEMAHIIIVNSREVCLDSPVEYWGQRPPYQTSIFNRRPHKPDGVGVADGAVGQQIILNQLFSLFVDLLKMDVYAPFAIKVDQMIDPTQIADGIAPGETIHLFGEGKAQDAFGTPPSRTNPITPTLIQTLEMLKLSAQKSASLSTISSNPTSRARISSAEVQDNVGQRNLTLNALGSELDYSCLEPTIGLIEQHVLQFGFEDSNLSRLTVRGVITDAEYEVISRIPREERFIESRRHYKIEIRGFRAVMQKQQELRNTSEFLSQVAQFPQQVALTKINWSEFLRQTIERYGFDANKIVNQNTPFDKAMEENNLLRVGHLVSIIEDDEDPTHLPVHYQLALEIGPSQGLVSHIMGHINRMLQRGEQPPPPPAEIAQMFGMQAQTPAQKSGANAAKKIEGEQSGQRLLQ